MGAGTADPLAADAAQPAPRRTPRPGIVAAGAISSRGTRTNARSCMRGCGSVSLLRRRRRLPTSRRSRSRTPGQAARFARLASPASLRRSISWSPREQRARTELRPERGGGVDVVGLRPGAAYRRALVVGRHRDLMDARQLHDARAPPARAGVADGRDCCPARDTRARPSLRRRLGIRRRMRVAVGPFAAAAARAALLFRSLVRTEHRFALGVGRVGEALPPLGEIGELAFEFAARAAQRRESPTRRGSAGARAGGTGAARSAARSAAAAPRFP